MYNIFKFKKKGKQGSNLLSRISTTYIPIKHCLGFLEITTCIRNQPKVIKVIRFTFFSFLGKNKDMQKLVIGLDVSKEKF